MIKKLVVVGVAAVAVLMIFGLQPPKRAEKFIPIKEVTSCQWEQDGRPGLTAHVPVQTTIEPGNVVKLYVRAKLAEPLRNNWDIWRLELFEIRGTRERSVAAVKYFREPDKRYLEVSEVFANFYKPGSTYEVDIGLHPAETLEPSQVDSLKEVVAKRSALIVNDHRDGI